MELAVWLAASQGVGEVYYSGAWFVKGIITEMRLWATHIASTGLTPRSEWSRERGPI